MHAYFGVYICGWVAGDSADSRVPARSILAVLLPDGLPGCRIHEFETCLDAP
jgi:hypothetical protein